MGYASRWTGEVRIEPPLTWGEIKNSKHPGFQDLKLRLDETVEDTATGQVRTVTASAVVPLTAEAYNGYQIEEELTAFAEEHSATHTLTGRIQARGPEGDLWAFTVDGPSVTRIEPTLTWPDRHDVPAFDPERVLQDYAAQLVASPDPDANAWVAALLWAANRIHGGHLSIYANRDFVKRFGVNPYPNEPQ